MYAPYKPCRTTYKEGQTRKGIAKIKYDSKQATRRKETERGGNLTRKFNEKVIEIGV